jgi:tRNA pseudouridine32 synthase/23S rRNA pseudouridine746 synthase
VEDNCFIPFKTDIELAIIPNQLNSPFDLDTPEICKIAAKELQGFIKSEQDNWIHNFGFNDQKKGHVRGKMFGVLVVKTKQGALGYLSTFSGTLADQEHPEQFVPSVFDIATDDYFINKGMAELGGLSIKINSLQSENDTDVITEIEQLKTERAEKSAILQQQLFDNYNFMNVEGISKNLCVIFEEALNKRPPSGAGECAAPKLLQYAFEHEMQPLAIAEFWWGKPPKTEERKHGEFYPACEKKCRPILGYMLGA